MFALELLLRMAGCFLLTCTVLVTAQYFVAWSRNRRDPLLPMHVWMVALSYNLLLVTVMTRELNDWRALIYVPAVFLGAAGMYALMRHLLKTAPRPSVQFPAPRHAVRQP